VEYFPWERFPALTRDERAYSWLTCQINLCLATSTIFAYARALNYYLDFCARIEIPAATVSREHILLYIRELATRPKPQDGGMRTPQYGPGLANATIQQYVTVVRLFYDYLVEEGLRENNPVGRGRYTPNKGFGGARERGLVPHFHKLPWIPDDKQWLAILYAVRNEPIRNRVMFTFAYDAALRREELCSLRVDDINPGQELIRVRAETTKNRQERMVPYSKDAGVLYAQYLQHRRTLTREREALFVSESRRNHACPLSIWTWSKVIARIGERAGIPQFSTHTLRHLCLTDLARSGWDIGAIARFAGHRSIETTRLYIQLSGRDLKDKLAKGMAAIHSWRIAMIVEQLGDG
jgi:integrase/recombinase XerD